MSAQPDTPAYDPHRLNASDGPQTVRELRAALAVLAPAALVRFEQALDGAQLADVPQVLSEYRHVWALHARPEVTTAATAPATGHLVDAFAALGYDAA